MAERYTSLIAVVVDRPVDDVGEFVLAAVRAGDLDRAAPLRDEGEVAQEVLWGGRMQKAVVRRVEDAEGTSLLRTETYIGSDGLRQGIRRHALLVQALVRQLPGRVEAIRDLSAEQDHDESWVHRLAGGLADLPDVVAVHEEGQGTWWLHTHGAARFDVPDLELYGLRRSQLPAARDAIRHVHGQLLRGGLRAELSLPDGAPVYLVPVIEAWRKLPLDWPGIGRADKPRPGHDGPRATLSLLHPPRLGRYRQDLKGLLGRL